MAGFIAVLSISILLLIFLSVSVSWALRWQMRIDGYADIYRKRSERRAVYIKDNYSADSRAASLCDEVIGACSISERFRLDELLTSSISGYEDSVLDGFEEELRSYYSLYRDCAEEFRKKGRRWYGRIVYPILGMRCRGRFDL